MTHYHYHRPKYQKLYYFITVTTTMGIVVAITSSLIIIITSRHHSSSSFSSSAASFPQVVLAYHTSNYYHFFTLYERAPHMSAYLMDFLVQRMRIAAYQRMIKAYFPTLTTRYIKKTLSFHTEKECVDFIKSQGGVFTSRRGGGPFEMVDIKASRSSRK